VSDYQLTMTLEGIDPNDAQVRVWIDSQPSGDPSSEQEIELVRDAEASWSGLFSAEGEAFIYRVGICAAPGGCWSLSVRDAAQDGEELLYDSDMLTMAKEWFVGSCEPPLLESASASAKMRFKLS
jgi:hypothetical protein